MGRTAQDPDTRLYQHLNAAKHRGDTYSFRWLRQLMNEELSPELWILEFVQDDDNWEDREQHWIAYGRSEGWPLTNMTAGGDGVVDPCLELRQLRSELAKGNRNAAGERSDEFRQRMAEVAKVTKNALGHKLSDETKQQISDNLRAWYDQGGEAPHGEENGQSKLTEDQVREIRQRYARGGVSMRGLAKEYPVTYSTIRMIVLRKYWQHVN